ncbi:MAG: type III-B CRISPR module RAMP protein Cmr4 [Chloroflexi bacterium]|nr:type III-B CRISPR module RAMP protein Cmr4 [Chloroflexota bacterium]
MFTKSNLLFLYVETPLHAGSGSGMGGIDLQIQRERATAYPLVQGTSLKGRLRAAIREKNGWPEGSAEIAALFGRAEDDGDGGGSYAGCVSPGDAKILLFPVRSLAGVFAWTTSVNVLARFRRDALAAGLSIPWQLPAPLEKGQCLVAAGSALAIGDQVVLEEFSYEKRVDEGVGAIARWLAGNALPGTAEYDYWRNGISSRLVVLAEDEFRDFTRFSTEVVTRVKLAPDTKTVQSGALWTEEYLPSETLLYSPLLAGATRSTNGVTWTADEVLDRIRILDGSRTQLGGDETTGRGLVHLRFLDREVRL